MLKRVEGVLCLKLKTLNDRSRSVKNESLS